MGNSWKLTTAFAISWAITVTACVVWNFTQRGWFLDTALLYIALVYFTGALTGGYLALVASNRWITNKPATVRFSFFFIALSALTLAATAAILVLQHRIYFTQWHAPVGTIQWSFQLFFTALGSVFLFLISGLRPLLPWGILGLFIASVLFSRGSLTRSR